MGVRQDVSSLFNKLEKYQKVILKYSMQKNIHEDIAGNVDDILSLLSDAIQVVGSLLKHFDDDYLCKHSRDIAYFQFDVYNYIDTALPLISKYDPESQDDFNHLMNWQEDAQDTVNQLLDKIRPNLEFNPATKLRFEGDSRAMITVKRDPKASRLKNTSKLDMPTDDVKYPYGIIYEAVRSAHAARIEALSLKFDALVEARSESAEEHKETLVQHLPYDVTMPLMEEGFLNLASLEKILTPDYHPEQAKVTRTQYMADNRALQKVNQQLCQERTSYYTFTAGYIGLRTSEAPTSRGDHVIDFSSPGYPAYKLF